MTIIVYESRYQHVQFKIVNTSMHESRGLGGVVQCTTISEFFHNSKSIGDISLIFPDFSQKRVVDLLPKQFTSIGFI